MHLSPCWGTWTWPRPSADPQLHIVQLFPASSFVLDSNYRSSSGFVNPISVFPSLWFCPDAHVHCLEWSQHGSPPPPPAPTGPFLCCYSWRDRLCDCMHFLKFSFPLILVPLVWAASCVQLFFANVHWFSLQNLCVLFVVCVYLILVACLGLTRALGNGFVKLLLCPFLP